LLDAEISIAFLSPIYYTNADESTLITPLFAFLTIVELSIFTDKSVPVIAPPAAVLPLVTTTVLSEELTLFSAT
jgi:hypothetical protein